MGVNDSCGTGSGATVVVAVGLGSGAAAVCVADGSPITSVAVAVNPPGDRLQEADSVLRQIMRSKDNLFIRPNSS